MTDRYADAVRDTPREVVVPPAPSSIDLHTHTLRSDGVLSPAELVRQAHAAGVRLLAITDHDTLAGYREVIAAGVPDEMELVSGVEINAVVRRGDDLWEGEVHVLGFGMDPRDDAFEAALAGQRAERRIRFERILGRLRDLDMPIDAELERLRATGADDDALGRPTVGRALVAAGHATSVEDAFRRLLGRGMPAYVPRSGLGPDGAIASITAAGGVPVLAHFAEAEERIGVVRELVELGLRGLEVHYRSFDRPTVDSLAAVAASCGLVATGGSDYHGDYGAYLESHESLWVPPEVGAGLKAEIARHSLR